MIGQWLVDGLHQHFNDFWANVHLPPNHPVRIERKMPERQTREWFIKNILKGKGEDRKETDTIHDLVPGIPLYDALAVLAAVPQLASHFFSPTRVDTKGIYHDIIGISPGQHGVIERPRSDAGNLIDGLLSLMTSALKRSKMQAKYRPMPNAAQYHRSRSQGGVTP